MFEYDPRKSQASKSKHGLDFEETQLLWNDLQRAEIKAFSEMEPRFMIIGKIGDKHWSAMVTYREDKVQLISVRRSHTDEIKICES